MKRVSAYVLDRLGEAGTWQAIGFVVGLTTARYKDMDWGAAAAFGGVVSAAIKAFFPDIWDSKK